MKKEAFKILLQMEGSWWYRARSLVVSRCLQKYLTKKNSNKVLDFGSGYGGMSELFKQYGEVDAFEVEEECVEFCKNRGYANVFSNLDQLYIKSNYYDVVCMLDVLEHIENDKEALQKIKKMLSEDGKLVITVPAFMMLWSVHDEEHKHFRRYTLNGLIKLLTDSGFKINYSSYWNMFLFLPAAIIRLLGFSGSSSFNSTGIVNKFFYKIVYLETLLMKYIKLPFGVSIVLIATKNEK